MKKILIGIQARSTSTRLPKKSTELIYGKTILDRVVSSCNIAAANIKKSCYKKDTETSSAVCIVAVLTPDGDPIATQFSNRTKIITGSLEDVLGRYTKAADEVGADYIVRITGDCPLIPPFVIFRHVTLALANDYDYLSNVFDDCRTSPDGFDCEVMSKKFLAHLNKNATDALDREHVTTFGRKELPAWAKYGHILNSLDQSEFKYSVDTPEDLVRVRDACERLEVKRQAAMLRFGQKAVHYL